MPRESLLASVRARLAIPARKPTQEVLDGEYGSIHRGRSMDFDDLREYTVGDDVKDIDWKATARAGRPLIKRYVASRRHAVLLVVDTGRTMAALADATSLKRDIAVLAAGVFGEVAIRHGDSVGLVAGPVATTVGGAGPGNPHHTAYIPPLRGDVHLERLLRTIHDAIDLGGEPSDPVDLLRYVATHFQRRMIVVVVADDDDLDDRSERMLRRLAAQHEMLYCTIGDVTMTEPALASTTLRAVETGTTIPAYFRSYPGLHDDLTGLARQREAARQATLARAGIGGARVASEHDVIPSIIGLLERQRLFGVQR